MVVSLIIPRLHPDLGVRNPVLVSVRPIGHIEGIVLPPNPYSPVLGLVSLAAGAIEDETRVIVLSNIDLDGKTL